VKALLLARHAHAGSNEASVVNAVPPGAGLSPQGFEEARELGRLLASTRIDLGVSSRLRRARETLEVALDGRGIPLAVAPLLDEISFGSFEGRTLEAYRAWAWAHDAGDPCPGGGETRVDAAVRIASGLDWLLERPEEVILAVSHALPIRYVLDASDGAFPGQRIAHVPHAQPFRLGRPAVERAAETLRRWAAAPAFADTPIDGSAPGA
jgi:broad specificity phosphatase PhoE